MDIKEVYYGALIDYRKHTLNNKECIRQRKLIGRTDAEIDEINIAHNECEIEDDWIDAIEAGLDFIEKAIKEERQFILSNGEVVPIEKVKNVSVESVEHLSKHSNLLTRAPEEGKDIIPDKLYAVERLTDYSVYENRFLYMLLCYLRDFISRRYDDLVRLTTTYEGKLKINKKISSGNRNTQIEINLDEILKNDQYLHKHNSSRDKIKRINLLLNAVQSFLAHPLMEAVSNAPMIKPPITETNVLKMNKNFKGAVKLYYFITSYDKPGYSVERVTKKVKPFKEIVSEEFAEVVELCSFLTYEHGLGLTALFKEEYDKEQKRLQELEKEKKLEQLKALRRRIKENGGNVEEYLLMLEQRNRLLETENAQLLHYKAELAECLVKNEQLQKEIEIKQKTIEQLTIDLEEKIAEIENLKIAHQEEIENLNFEHEQQISALHSEYQSKMQALEQEFEEKIEKIQNDCQDRIDEIERKCEQDINELETKYQGEISDLEQKHKAEINQLEESFNNSIIEKENHYNDLIEGLNKEHGELVEKLNLKYDEDCGNLSSRVSALDATRIDLEKQLQDFTSRAYVAEARVNALKKESGLYDGKEDYNSHFGFDELERQFIYFKKLFKEEWKNTKRTIREKHLKITTKSEQKLSEKSEEPAKAEENVLQDNSALNNENVIEKDVIEDISLIENKDLLNDKIELDLCENKENNVEDQANNVVATQELELISTTKENVVETVIDDKLQDTTLGIEQNQILSEDNPIIEQVVTDEQADVNAQEKVEEQKKSIKSSSVKKTAKKSTTKTEGKETNKTTE